MSAYVSGCFIYPLKSGHRIEVNKLSLTDRGPENDRRWMLVHAQGKKANVFVSQRDKGCEKLALVYSNQGGDTEWYFSAPHMEDHPLYYDEEFPYQGTVRIHKDDCSVIDMGNKTSEWFSRYLDMPVRLVRLPDDYIRPVNPNFARAGDNVGLADGHPLLITNPTSLEKLSEHFPPNIEINMNRFRPNIVVEGLQPFEEDIIQRVKIGDTVLEFMKPCDRCAITTVEQDSGIKNHNPEPIKTLIKQRYGEMEVDGKMKPFVFFGQKATPRQLGTISVGDKVEILETGSMHPAVEQVELKFES